MKKHDINRNDVDLIARTIMGEAATEPRQGKAAIAWVIMNRVAQSNAVKGGLWWGNTIEQVIRKQWQFSCWNSDNPNLDRMLSAECDDKIFCECLMVALGVLSGKIPDPTDGATHYYATYIPAPEWTKGAEFTGQIGLHKFYKNVK